MGDRLNPHVDIGRLRIYVNLGTGPVDNSREEDATKNIEQLVKDVGLEGVTFRRDPPKDCGEGRFAYQLNYRKRDIEVQMPGLSLEQVRLIEGDGRSGWGVPRLYISEDHCSWLWPYAVKIVKDEFENPQWEKWKE